jgi:hypothetical protein
MDNPMDNPPTPGAVRIITGRGEDMDAAWLWLQAVLSPLPPEVREAELRHAPALSVLLAYRAAILRSQHGPPN